MELAFRLLLPLLFLACLENSGVRWNPALTGIAVVRLVTGPTGEPIREPGGGLLLLDVLLIVGGDTIALLQIRLKKTEPMSLLPDLDVRMEVRLVVPALLGSMIDRLVLGRLDRIPGKTGTDQELVVDPLGLRVQRMTTVLVRFESVDFARDDSFRAVLGLIRGFHDMAEPAGVPSARCKTSLASAYGLMSEVSPAFTLPASPLLRTLLFDINLALSKFLEDQTVHGFLPVPGRRHRRYYSTSSSSFPGPYTVPPGVTSITLEKVSEAKKRSVSLSASQVSSMETMLSGVCEVSSWLDCWLSTCGGFQDHLPIEVRADFERLMISGSRALEFLASQGCTTLGNLVLARRDSLLAVVHSTVPAEEVARLRYSPLPETASIFPHHLLDSALLKMRAAASDALVQRGLHPPRIPRKPAATGQSSGSSTARSGQAGTSGASQAQKQSSSSSPSGQSGQRKKKSKGKAPFSSSSRGSGRSGSKGKGAGKKSA